MATPIAEGVPASVIDDFLAAFDETDDDHIFFDLTLHLGHDQQIDPDPISNLCPIPPEFEFTHDIVSSDEGGTVHSTAAESG